MPFGRLSKNHRALFELSLFQGGKLGRRRTVLFPSSKARAAVGKKRLRKQNMLHEGQEIKKQLDPRTIII